MTPGATRAEEAARRTRRRVIQRRLTELVGASHRPNAEAISLERLTQPSRDGARAVAVLPLAVTAAGAGLVAAATGVLPGVDIHELRGRAADCEQLGHGAHRLLHVVEEELVAGAQVVLAALTVWRGGEAVLRAAAVAREAHVAVEAVLGQRVALVLTELDLFRGGYELLHRRLGDVA